jgi:hypothetical protein
VCKMWCEVCRDWVKREGHECQKGETDE